MLSEPCRRRDALKPGYVFRDARTGRFVSRVFALLWPQYTMKQKVR